METNSPTHDNESLKVGASSFASGEGIDDKGLNANRQDAPAQNILDHYAKLESDDLPVDLSKDQLEMSSSANPLEDYLQKKAVELDSRVNDAEEFGIDESEVNSITDSLEEIEQSIKANGYPYRDTGNRLVDSLTKLIRFLTGIGAAETTPGLEKAISKSNDLIDSVEQGKTFEAPEAEVSNELAPVVR